VNSTDRIYLDHAATTAVLPEVAAAMEPWISNEFGNPSSLHAEGRKAKAAIDQSREIIADALGCLFAEVIFTSSGTEAANLAIIGAALANNDRSRKRILFSAVEHHCVLHTAPILQRLGYEVEIIPVSRIGKVRLDVLENMLSDDVLLVSVMHANNELGVIEPVQNCHVEDGVESIPGAAQLSHNVGALFHVDCVQTFVDPGYGRLIQHIGADLINVSAHKINGPKGSGALYVRAGTKIKPLAVGGGQERELRAGTENIAAIVGFGEAVKWHSTLDERDDSRYFAKDAFFSVLVRSNCALPTVPDFGQTLAGHLHVRIPGVQAETMLILLDRMGVSASSGAACSSGSIEPSHVLLACGYTPEEAKEGLRFTFGHATTIEEAQEAAGRVNEAAARLTSGKLTS